MSMSTGSERRSEDVEFTQECAGWLGWNFDRQCGDPDLLQELVLGPWETERFVIVEPGADNSPDRRRVGDRSDQPRVK